MRRIFWIGVGAAAAVLVVRQLAQARAKADAAAEAFTPAGFADLVARGVDTLRDVGTEIAAAMREHEAELRADLLPPPDEVAAARARRASAPRPARGRDEDDGADAELYEFF
ncbi:hypothetical protein Bcav_2013 [Beutenbergia cavernae DSM 12333]|uniref:Secreted protein n=1 Tax=Beutenbergia cavernae (strain ATCC BAA-8 / DSM 12333 / CCUG 43141 / JCM 11478 / NBRC 16432 / NCIMB 13614 / HKI 0122) TaxID=471853 RepID=C5C5S7_BEUC1|nr:hypothetical protein [Beutenbergia cavernae]ACQ80268.1 hypothetical protein Bcav_2013 [Beutenbergia cavernae DSM 12333]